MTPRAAAILTVGTELTEGLRTDTNTAEIARAVSIRGFTVLEALSVSDDVALVTAALRRLIGTHELVIVTGGLGPTHDDITRAAAAAALDRPLVRDPRLVDLLDNAVRRHKDEEAADRVLLQADVVEGADVIDPTTGTAPGLLIQTGVGMLALLPGPPSEMRPMLDVLVSRYEPVRSEPAELGVVGLSESDAQVVVSRVLETSEGVGFTVLAKPGDVRILLFDDGAGPDGLSAAVNAVGSRLGDRCYSGDGATLAEVVIGLGSAKGATLACAESCTGGLVAAALTDVSGASAVFEGGAVTYSDAAKTSLLGVPRPLIASHGAVSEEVVREMALGARERFGADIAVAVTGIAGPSGGSADKPVGLVWFATADSQGVQTHRALFPQSGRGAVRARSTAAALDLFRLALLKE